MPQTGEFDRTVLTTDRLLPGDRAPGLRLARVFNRTGGAGQVTLNRVTAVVLWNAGCAGCLPVVGEIAELGESKGVPCYGVAVMVRDVERTAAAAGQGNPKAVLALEEQLHARGLARGAVTRQWLEASGQQAVPAAFLVDGHGLIAWMGDPAEIPHVLPEVLDGTWDVAAARERRRATISDDEIAALCLTRDVTDALVTGEITTARSLIEAGETARPAVAQDREFNIIKLHAWAASPASEQDAVAHYVQAAALNPDDLRSQSSLATIIVRSFPESRAALAAVRDRLAGIGNAPAASPAEPILCKLLLAEAEIRLGLADEAMAGLEKAEVLASAPDLPPAVQTWATSEIERLRSLFAADTRALRPDF